MKSAYLLALIPATLLLNGCNDAESEVCRYYVQNDLDTGNFESAIERLEDESCQDTYPNKEYLVDLSSAYLGKSGLPLPVIIRAMIEDDSEDGESSEEVTFDSFVNEITDSAEPSVLSDLSKSRSALDEYLEQSSCTAINDITSSEETVCLITGFIDVLKTTMAIDALAGGDVAGWVNNESGMNPGMLRSSCALKYSYEHKNDDDFTTPYNGCESGVSVDASDQVTFTSASGIQKTYNQLTISYAAEPEYFLESEELGSTVFTNNFCRVDYTVCDTAETGVCYSCPLSQDAVDLNIQDYLLDSLNNGFDSIESVITSGDDEESDIQEAIDDFKKEIKSEGCEDLAEDENCFTMDDIVDYLNKK